MTSLESTATLEDVGVAISIDGGGRCMDNIFVERAARARLCPKPSNCKNSQMASKPNGHRPMDTVSQYRMASLRPGRYPVLQTRTTSERIALMLGCLEHQDLV